MSEPTFEDIATTPFATEAPDLDLRRRSRALAAPGMRWPTSNIADAFRAIVVPGNGTNAARYTLSGFDYLEIVSVSASVDASGAGANTEVTFAMFEQSGVQISANRTGAAIQAGLVGEVTFAAYLPDTSQLPGAVSPDFIQSGMPIALLLPQNSVRVTAVDPGAIITELRLWVWNADARMTDLSIPPAIRLQATG